MTFLLRTQCAQGVPLMQYYMNKSFPFVAVGLFSISPWAHCEKRPLLSLTLNSYHWVQRIEDFVIISNSHFKAALIYIFMSIMDQVVAGRIIIKLRSAGIFTLWLLFPPSVIIWGLMWPSGNLCLSPSGTLRKHGWLCEEDPPMQICRTHSTEIPWFLFWKDYLLIKK